MRRRASPAVVGLAVAAVVALALPEAALAHATLQATTPKAGQRIESSPPALVLHFDQRIDVLPNMVQVLDATGTVVSKPPQVRASDPRSIQVALSKLVTGPYTVRWAAISQDSHVVRGVFTFGVRVDAPPVTSAFGASGPTTSEHVVRWLYFLSLVLLVGGLGFRLAILPRHVPAATERRFYRLTGIGVVAAIHVGVLAFMLRAQDALQLPFTGFLYGDLSPLANGTRFGAAFIVMTLGFALAAGLLFLAWLTGRRWLLWLTFLLSLGLTSGLSLSGHSGDDPGWLSSFADWVHLTAGSLWLGGLLSLVAVVWPTTARELRRRAFWRFSEVAGVLVALVIGAGVYLGFQRLPAVHDLWSEAYGRVLLLKLGLVWLALLWGAFHHFLVRPRLDRGGVVSRLPRTLVAESTVGVAVFLLAAILVDSKPPPKPSNTVSQGASAAVGMRSDGK